MNKPGWGGQKPKTQDNDKVLLVYRLPKNNECIIFFQNPGSGLSRQEQIEHVKADLKATESIWRTLIEGGVASSCTIRFTYTNPDGSTSKREENLMDIMRRVDAAGKPVDFKNVAAEIIKDDGYQSYIPIVQRSFLTEKECGVYE